MTTIQNMLPITNFKKTIIFGVLIVCALILFIMINPFSWNDAGNRTVVERTKGSK